ncbi:MAG TPA: protein phosphatase CheZ [Dissulfurispiraceae bacterium]|nr:protein phosphatase CheZ [Dissulfurispiraceae bacterium]
MQHIGFVMNGSEYTIPILKVQEIINRPQLTRLPQAPHYIDGVTNLRGRIIPIVNLKKLVGLDEREPGQKVIVVSSGRMTFGVLIDGITGVISIEDDQIEPADTFLQGGIEQVQGVARVNDRLVVLIDTSKLVPVEDADMFEDQVLNVGEAGKDKVEIVKHVQTMGGEVLVKEIVDAKAYFESKSGASMGANQVMFERLVEFMTAVSNQDFEKADDAMKTIMSAGDAGLFREVGKVTRKLHDSIRSFKEALDPKLKDMAVTEMPNAVDQLQLVIERTEAAANKTMSIVEKYILSMDDVSSHLRNMTGPEESIAFLKSFKNSLEDDLTEVLTTQSFQDLTGQSIKKVINLVGDIEGELVRLIATFGVKMEPAKEATYYGPGSNADKVSQEGVDDLLKDFGF